MMISNTIKTIFLFLVVISLMILSCTPKQQNEHLVKSTIQKWENDAWVDSVQTLYFYDSKGYLVEQKNFQFSDDRWVDSDLMKISYNKDNLRSIELIQVFDRDHYKDSAKLIYEYDNGVLDMVRGYNWDDSTWTEITQTKYTYDQDGNLLDCLQELKLPETNEWEKHHVISYSYENNAIEIQSDFWENNELVKGYKEISEFENNMLTKSFFSNMEVEYEDMNQAIFKYDDSGREIELTSYSNFGDTLLHVCRSFKKYDNDFVADFFSQNWENDNWINWFRVIYEYENCEYLPEDLEVMFKSGLIIERYYGYAIYNHCKVFAKFIH